MHGAAIVISGKAGEIRSCLKNTIGLYYFSKIVIGSEETYEFLEGLPAMEEGAGAHLSMVRTRFRKMPEHLAFSRRFAGKRRD